MANRRLAEIRSWALFYGAENPPDLGKYDLAVVAPEAWPSTAISTLRARGTKVVAYLSVLEVPRREGEVPDDVLRVAGNPMEQTRWNTWILDPRRPGTADRLGRLATELAGRFDGIFLDTVGDVESALIPAAHRSLLIPGAARLIAGLRERLPHTTLVQNWGLGALLDLTLPYVDAVCWEDFPTGPAQAWQQELAARMQWVRGQGVQVLALSSRQDAQAQRWSAQLGFPWYGAPGTYIELAGGS